jgi:hypothetical protein
MLDDDIMRGWDEILRPACRNNEFIDDDIRDYISL